MALVLQAVDLPAEAARERQEVARAAPSERADGPQRQQVGAAEVDVGHAFFIFFFFCCYSF